MDECPNCGYNEGKEGTILLVLEGENRSRLPLIRRIPNWDIIDQKFKNFSTMTEAVEMFTKLLTVFNGENK